jgi:hypothetical protein
MIRKLVLAPLLALGLVLAVAAPAAGATAADVRGLWTGVDPADGSNQSLIVASAGTTVRVVYFDDNATGACDSVPVLLTGRGTLSGDTFTVSLSGICFDGTRTGPFEVSYTYDGGPPESLTDSLGGTWNSIFG